MSALVGRVEEGSYQFSHKVCRYIVRAIFMLFASGSEKNERYRDSGNFHFVKINHIRDKEIKVSQTQNHKLITVATCRTFLTLRWLLPSTRNIAEVILLLVVF